MISIWTIVSVILLAIYWRGKNAVWGGFTIGIIIGSVLALFNGFDWGFIGKGAVSGILIGFGSELLGKVSDMVRDRG